MATITEIKFVDPTMPLSALQNLAASFGLILQINKHTGQKIMASRRINETYEVIKSGYKAPRSTPLEAA